MTLRIYADFNSGGGRGQGPCWALRYGEDFRPLDDVAESLGLRQGMPVTLYHSDQEEEFEVAATLVHDVAGAIKWKALPDWSTYRQIRG